MTGVIHSFNIEDTCSNAPYPSLYSNSQEEEKEVISELSAVQPSSKKTKRPVFSTKIPVFPVHTKVMYIARGLPGSGKSTFCTNFLAHLLDLPLKRDEKTGRVIRTGINYRLCQNFIMSTDDFFTTVDTDGKLHYKYNLNELQMKHTMNKNRATTQAALGITPLFIDNTNVNMQEIKPYVDIGKNYGYEIVIVNPEQFYQDGTNYQKSVKNPEWLFNNRNEKGVPMNIYLKMSQKFEEIAKTHLTAKN